MRTVTHYWLAVLTLLLLSGCASNSPRPAPQSNTVALTDNSQYTLAKTPANLIGQGYLSHIKGSHNDNDYELLVQVELNKNNIVMVGTTVSGLELFELVWFDHKPWQLKQSSLAKAIKPEYLLADFQLVHWPLPSINEHLKGAKMTQNETNALRERVVKQGQQPIITITSQAQQTTFEQHSRGYRLNIKILEKWTQ
ncbi:MAG: DUF3261 domain-containing protein [Psychrosphaera sp.]|nr:DUF3261 domain-containing protein [Psychrosphaera sp.]